MRFKIFLTAFLLSLSFWWGINLLEKNLEDIFFWQEVSQNTQIFTAQISPISKPVLLESVEPPQIAAKSAISVFLNDKKEMQVLFENNAEQKLPIASLTKLMTALVVLENYDLSKEIKVSKEAVSQEETFGQLQAGRVFPVEYLLYPLLMESSNDAAFALSNDYEGMNEKKFVEMMNTKAKDLGLENTCFFNSSGLEPDNAKTKINYSTANDLVKLTKYLLSFPKIWQILSTPKYNLYGPELINTNELLFDESLSWRIRIVGGKTGYADEAGGCMLLVLRAPKNKGLLINVVLGTANSNVKFEEMKKLVEWLNHAYRW